MPDGAAAPAEQSLAPPPETEAAEAEARFPAPAEPEPVAEVEEEPEPAADDDLLPKFDIPGLSATAEAPETPPAITIDVPTPLAAPDEDDRGSKDAAKEHRDESAGRRTARRIVLSALAAAAAAIILVGGAIFLQPQITGLVPAAASLYARMGLHSDIPGLGLEIVEPKLGKVDDEILQIVGVIRNATKSPMQIPVMQARLLDGDGKPLNVWLFRATKEKIAPGETVEYKTEFRNPPAKAERLDITFSRDKPAEKEKPALAHKPTPEPKQDKPTK